METEKQEINMYYSDILVTLGNILDPNIRGEIYLGKRSINSQTYEDKPLPQDDLSKEGYEYNKIIEEQIEKEINKGQLTLTMFTCPNGDATDVKNDFPRIIPTKFNQDQVFVQRLPLLLNLIKTAERQEIPINLNVIIGDTDFLTYYYPMIESNNIDVDFERYIKRVTTYRDSLVCKLRDTFSKNGIWVDICSYGDQDITNLGLRETKIQKSTINVISLMLNTLNWGTDEIDSRFIDQKDIKEEAFYTSRRCNNSRRFDKTIFADKEDSVYVQMARIKAKEYREQGKIVKDLGGKIILMDELPPALKTRFLTNKGDLLFIFPWIRNEDVWRTRNSNELEIVNEMKRTLKG
ncbi:hypothetical protein K8R14_04780 [bacterium]|nr:hypothetical protein [bacterium]